MNSLETDSYTATDKSYYSKSFSYNSELSTEYKTLFFEMKQQLKKTLRKFILYIVTVLIYILMKKIKSNFTKKLY